jgi:hypothetical protein
MSEQAHENWMAIDFCRNSCRFAVAHLRLPSDAGRRVARGSSYDGTWSVAIYTLRGDCGSLRAALRIIGGRVSSGDGSYQAYGAVGAGGAIRVTLIRGSQSASGSGRLSSNSGGGRWRTSGGSVLDRGQRRGKQPTNDRCFERYSLLRPLVRLRESLTRYQLALGRPAGSDAG